MTRVASLLLICVLFTSCTQSESKKQVLYYFDVKELIKQELERLDTLRPLVRKTVVLNSQQELRETNDIDWSKELSVFKEADINKSAWRDQYSADTIFTNPSAGQFSQIDYIALDEDLKCRRLSIFFLRNTAEAYKLEAKLERKNFLYEITQDIGISLGASYFIDSRQKVVFLQEKAVSIRAEFLR